MKRLIFVFLVAGAVGAITASLTGGRPLDSAPLSMTTEDHRAVAPLTSSVRTTALADYGNLSINFEPYTGQAPSPVKYQAKASGYSVGLTDQGPILSLAARKEEKGAEGTTLQMKVARANRNMKLIPEQHRVSVSNYFQGNDPANWRRNVPNYGAVRYEGVYPGIDWLVYGNQHQLEYDFVVAPHADPKRIQFGFDGADQLALDTDGSLLVTANGRTLRQHVPVIYQDSIAGTRQSIPGYYVLDESQQYVSIALGNYDPNRRLVIDPVLSYSTYLGGRGDYDYDSSRYDGDGVNGITVDKDGNAYIVGTSWSADFPTASPFQGTNKAAPVGSTNVFVAKLDPSGQTLLYSTYLGGSSTSGDGDYGFGIAVDSSGSAYVTGDTNSSDFPTVNAFQVTKSSNAGNAFVAKLNPSGSSLLFSTFLGGSNSADGQGFTSGAAIAVDGAGSAYIAGRTRSPDFPTANAFQDKNRAAANGGVNGFITKFSPSGNALVYSTYLGGSTAVAGYQDGINALALDSSGNVYVAGFAASTDFPTVNAFQAVNRAQGYSAKYNAFVAKLNSSGSALVYSTYLGGSGGVNGNYGDSALALALDSDRNAYVAGVAFSDDFPVKNAYQAKNAGAQSGNSNAFVTKLNASGDSLIYSTYLGGTGDVTGASIGDLASAIAVDSSGSAYVAGSVRSVDFPIVNPVQSANAGYNDAFVSVLTPSGSTLLYSTYLGGRLAESGDAIAVDSMGNVYLAGSTNSLNYPTLNAFQGQNKNPAIGGPNAFISKITAAPSTAPPAPPNGLTTTAGNGQITLSWTAVGDARSYSVYLGTTTRGESTAPIKTAITGTSFTVAGLTNGATYYFRVTSTNAVGEGAKSLEAQASPVSSGGQTTGASGGSTTGAAAAGSTGSGGGSIGWELIVVFAFGWLWRLRRANFSRSVRGHGLPDPYVFSP